VCDCTTALLLDRRGYRVFAGVRRDEDARSLSEQGSERLEPLKIDVAKQRSITAARKRVEDVAGSGRLVGLVNNAGVGGGGPIEFLDLDELRKVLEVNLIGQVAVTQAFLPPLRRAKGTVVFIAFTGAKVLNFAAPPPAAAPPA
jgi:NAD(P)-dependent dehydrogenase (short-subunit alcohol dehydrogenase family)